MILAAGYSSLTFQRLKEAVYLTARTSAMVCYLFIGSWTFSSVFSYLGGHEVIEHWVLAANLNATGFLILAQFIIFLLGWPLEWTEIIIIFVPIFLPLVKTLQYRPDSFRHPGRAQHPDLVQHAADGDGGLLPQGRGAAARAG